MPKKYIEIFKDSAEKQYLTGKYPLMAQSAANLKTGQVRFAPILGEWNDGTSTIPEYAIQRFKRFKEGDQQNTNDNAGDDYVRTLNQAVEGDWETLTTKRSTQKQLLIKVKKGEETNALADATPYERTIANATKNRLISKEERAVDTIINSAIANNNVVNITSLLTSASTQKDKREVIQRAFTQQRDHIEEFVDDFKYDSEAIALYYSRIGSAFSKTEGQDYQTGTNTFGDAFKNGFRYQDLDFLPEGVFKSKRLNASNMSNAPVGNDSDLIVIGIVMTNDAYQDAGLENGLIKVDHKLLRRSVVGHIYDDLNLILDKDRIKVITASATALKTITDYSSLPSTAYKKVNQA